MKRGTPRHPKVGLLCEILNIDLPTGVGILELLFHFTAEFAPQGDIGKYDDNRIEAGLMSQFRPKGKLILALIQAGWIDQDEVSRLIVHDWFEHADAYVKKRLERAGLQFIRVTRKVTGHCPPTVADNGFPPSPSPSPKPLPQPPDSANRLQEFLDGYPNKTKTDAAARAYVSTITTDQEHAALMAGLARWKLSSQWVGSLEADGGRFIPGPDKFIFERRWLEHPPPAVVTRPEPKASSAGIDPNAEWIAPWKIKKDEAA